jgi:hypothetical protein
MASASFALDERFGHLHQVLNDIFHCKFEQAKNMIDMHILNIIDTHNEAICVSDLFFFRGTSYLMLLHVIEYVMMSDDEKTSSYIIRQCEEKIKWIEKCKNKYPNHHHGAYMSLSLATIYSGIACIHFRNESYLKGVLALRQAWIQLVKSRHENSKHFTNDSEDPNEKVHQYMLQSDLQFGEGCFYFFLSLLPNSWKTGAELIGFQEDRKMGYDKLQHVLRLQEENKNQNQNTDFMLINYDSASYYLSHLVLFWIHSIFYENQVLALENIKYLEKWMNLHPLFHWIKGYMYRKIHKWQESVDAFKYATDRCVNMNYTSSQQLLNHELAQNYFIQNQFAMAQGLWIDFVSQSKQPSYKSWAAYQLAICYFSLLNENEYENEMLIGKIQHYLRMAVKESRDGFSYDYHAKRKSKYFLKYLYEEKQINRQECMRKMNRWLQVQKCWNNIQRNDFTYQTNDISHEHHPYALYYAEAIKSKMVHQDVESSITWFSKIITSFENKNRFHTEDDLDDLCYLWYPQALYQMMQISKFHESKEEEILSATEANNQWFRKLQKHIQSFPTCDFSWDLNLKSLRWCSLLNDDKMKLDIYHMF